MLFVDDYHIHSSQGVERVFHRLEQHPDNPIHVFTDVRGVPSALTTAATSAIRRRVSSSSGTTRAPINPRECTSRPLSAKRAPATVSTGTRPRWGYTSFAGAATTTSVS